MRNDTLLAFWFMLPAVVANGAPILAAHSPLLRDWDARLDFGKYFRGRPLLGSHKTWRGIISGVVLATLILWIQQLLAAHFDWPRYFTDGIDYVALPTLALGPLFGFGALAGDALKSFFKRRQGIRSGGSWLPYDQIDYIAGAVIASLPIITLTLRQYVVIFVIWTTFHWIANYAIWKIGLKNRPI